MMNKRKSALGVKGHSPMKDEKTGGIDSASAFGDLYPAVNTSNAGKPSRYIKVSIGVIVVLAGLTIYYFPTLDLIWRIANPQKRELPIASILISETSTTAKSFESRLEQQLDLAPLRKHFEPQQYASYCGVASSVIVLRALGNTKVNQDNFFSDNTKSVRARYDTFFGGMTLAQLGGLLRAHGATAKVIHAGDSSVQEFRELAKTNLSQKNNFVLVNYLRKEIQQKTGGHISPVAAYDAPSDRFLVLDVAEHKYPPVWVKTADLFRSMNTIDSDSSKTRGFVLVEGQ